MTLKIKYASYATLCLLMMIIPDLYAQETIKTITAFKQKANYTFSADWQYLSTDLYLMNSNKFSQLLIDIGKASMGKKNKKLNEESLQSLFIKAKIKNLKFFGGDVVYPIYNFKVTEDKGTVTVETGNIEVIRLIDNLPLNESNEVIDAEISGEAITEKNSNDFLRLIGTQLQNISKVTTTNVAILSLVGELGKFIESKTGGTHYKFNSTIRLYDGQDFNKKLHSVNIFVLAPSSMNSIDIMPENIKTYLDTTSNPQIDQAILGKMLNFKKYPMIVTVNYKSRYNSHPVIGDQINYEYLSERKLKIQNAYQNELINKSTYNQELKLIEFLEIFSDFKLNINNYKLNLKNNITNDYSKNLFVILKIYHNLLNIKKMRVAEFIDNPEFKEEFLPKYESVINTAGMYMNENNALANVKGTAELLSSNINFVQMANQNELCENNLRVLYSANVPDGEEKSQMAADLYKLRADLEKAYFAKTFSQVIKQINNLATDDAGFKAKERIEADFGDTYCKTCKTELTTALKNYNSRYQNARIVILKKDYEEINQQATSLVFSVLEKRKCIDKFVTAKADSLSPYKDLLNIEINKIDTLVKETLETLKIDIGSMDAQQLKEQNDLLGAYVKRLETGIANICKRVKGICDFKLD
jgi:hypothetical protein